MPSGKVNETRGQTESPRKDSSRRSTGFDRSRPIERAEHFATRQIEHDAVVLWTIVLRSSTRREQTRQVVGERERERENDRHFREVQLQKERMREREREREREKKKQDESERERKKQEDRFNQFQFLKC